MPHLSTQDGSASSPLAIFSERDFGGGGDGPDSGEGSGAVAPAREREKGDAGRDKPASVGGKTGSNNRETMAADNNDNLSRNAIISESGRHGFLVKKVGGNPTVLGVMWK